MSDKPRTDGQCHKCPAQADVQAGKYGDKPFEKTPCFACRGVDYRQFPHRGCTVVSFDAAPPVETASRHDAQDADEDSQVKSAVMSYLGILIALPALDREIVVARLHGKLFSQIASHVSAIFGKTVSTQAVHARMVKFIHDNRQMEYLFCDVVQKQKRRKKGKNSCRNQR